MRTELVNSYMQKFGTEGTKIDCVYCNRFLILISFTNTQTKAHSHFAIYAICFQYIFSLDSLLLTTVQCSMFNVQSFDSFSFVDFLYLVLVHLLFVMFDFLSLHIQIDALLSVKWLALVEYWRRMEKQNRPLDTVFLSLCRCTKAIVICVVF